MAVAKKVHVKRPVAKKAKKKAKKKAEKKTKAAKKAAVKKAKTAKTKTAKKKTGGSKTAKTETAKTETARTETAKTGPQESASNTSASPPSSSGQDVKGLRIRMYRVGFGDFFMLSVPTGDGPRHILIDCGVHAKDLGSIRDAVAQMAIDCQSKLALVIMTHRHADHISGFGTCAEAFAEITVDRVWMPWFEDTKNETAMAFQSSLTALAGRLTARLAARGDTASPYAAMADNITGGMAASGGSKNQKALDVLHNGFKNKPEHDYYRAGDPPTLPKDLVDAGFTAEILGPPSDLSLITKMTNKNNQFLTEATESDDELARSFPKAFQLTEDKYPLDAFKFLTIDRMKAMINAAQPDVLAAQAKLADNTLNNQSLVILFGFGGKNLLFAGDAQWGNWENFLYGGAFGTPGHTEMTDKATAILGKLDFYKVGHHGSTNATPKDAVAAMRMGCVCMCSTQIGAYNEVPREPLMQALIAQDRRKLARSDQVAVKGQGPNPAAGPLPQEFVAPTHELFIDYNF